MVTSVTPVLEQQHKPRAQARAGGQDAHVRFDFVAYLDSSTSTTQLANEPPDQSHVAARNRAGEYCCNQQFSITAITNSTGAISERYAYTAYGQPTVLDASGSILNASLISNRYTYTGREWDATLGLHHFRARWMSPSAGRFLGRDPIQYSDGSSLYMSYFAVMYVDPFGLDKSRPPVTPPLNPGGGGLKPGDSDCTIIGRNALSNGGYFGQQFFIGPVPVFLQWGYQLAGSVEVEKCKRCCENGKNVTDTRKTVVINGQFWFSGGIGFSVREEIGGWLMYGYVGVKLEGSANFLLTGTLRSDKCNGRDLVGEICGGFSGVGRLAGGGMISAMFGWFNVDIGVEIFGQSYCEGKACYDVETNQITKNASCNPWEIYIKGCIGVCFTKRMY